MNKCGALCVFCAVPILGLSILRRIAAFHTMSAPSGTVMPVEEASSAQSPTLAQLMNLLSISPSSGSARNSHTASVLRELFCAQSDVLDWLQGLGTRTEGEDAKSGALTLVEIDSVLLRWLHAAYLHAASLLGLAGRSDRVRAPPPATPLAGLIASSGLLAPFISGMDPATTRINVGHPTDDEATCASLSELLRVAGAALVTFTDYLSRPTISSRIPSDESALLFASLAIRSCLNPDVAETLAQELGELAAAHIWPGPRKYATPTPGRPPSPSNSHTSHSIPSSSSAEDINTNPARSPSPPTPEFARFSSFSVAHIRWLMHWLRAQLSDQFGAVRFLLGDHVGHKECLVASQQDKLVLLKLVPESLVAYVLYCRACLQFQQTKAASMFSSKGLAVAEALGDDAMRCQLLLINATASALGGTGPCFDYRDVVDKHAAALQARDTCLAWLPSQLRPLMDLEPELGIVADKVIAVHAARAAELSAQGGDVMLPVLRALYTVPEPSYLPPGAVEQEQEEEASASQDGGLSTIQEGDQGQGEGEGQQQQQQLAGAVAAAEAAGVAAVAAEAAAAAAAAAFTEAAAAALAAAGAAAKAEASGPGCSVKTTLSGSSRAAKAARPNGRGKP